MKKTFKLTIEGKNRDRVLEAVKDARLSEDQVHDLAVAVAEALSNAAVHGNALRPDARQAEAAQVA